MTKKSLILILVLVAAVLLFFWLNYDGQIPGNNLPVACTMEAKLCPDGSSVGRQGPKCEFAKCPDVSGAPRVADEITLGVGQKSQIGDLSLNLQEIVQDSRCPSDVTCIWAGLVETNVKISVFSKEEVLNISSGQSPYRFEGYDVSIVSVAPPKQVETQVDPAEYRVTFRITKAQ
jgi:hypothetical protein